MTEEEEENFAFYGSALEPFDEENLPRKKPMTIAEQCAYDEQGRRRFHGAFTGGFSAGYFNTVGSRDGWRPQQFKSTRASKAGSVPQKPEDFMDEEDNSAFGIAPMGITATDDFGGQQNEQKRKRERMRDNTGPIPGTPVLQCLLEPVRETVGIRILKSWGWKPGQGVGPRVTKTEKDKIRKKREKQKMYTCALPPGLQKKSSSESESDVSDDEYAQILLAPDDFELKRPDPKDDYFGLGYSGLDKRPVLSGHINLFEEPEAFRVQDKNKKLSIRGQAFGVGAFEAEDDDIYAKDDMSNYDFTSGPEKRSKSRWDKRERGSTCLEGFVPAKNPTRPKKMYPPPELPKDFVPQHKEKKSRFAPLSKEAIAALKRKEVKIEAEARASKSLPAMIIERTLNLQGREKTAEREKIEKRNTGMSWLDKLSHTTFVKGGVMGTGTEVDKNARGLQSHEEAAKSLKVCKNPRPSFADSDKQKRFEKFLEGENVESWQPLSMSEWEREQEIKEFEKAAKICENMDKEEGKEDEVPKNIDLSTLSGEEQMRAAAKMKMFGPLTRKTVPWRPVKIVCVRFNVAEPSTGCEDPSEGNSGKKKKKFSIFDAMSWEEMSKTEAVENPEPEPEQPSVIRILPPPNTDKERVFQESYEKIFGIDLTGNNPEPDVEPEPTHILSDEKKDLFQAIFLSSDEEKEDEEAEKSSAMNDEKVKAALIGNKAAAMNVQRNTSPPRGIFANVDLDSLLAPPESSKPIEKPDVEIAPVAEKSPVIEEIQVSSSSESDSDRKSRRREKKSKKEKKKHKHKDRRHKSKKKKHKKEKKSKH